MAEAQRAAVGERVEEPGDAGAAGAERAASRAHVAGAVGVAPRGRSEARERLLDIGQLLGDRVRAERARGLRGDVAAVAVQCRDCEVQALRVTGRGRLVRRGGNVEHQRSQ